MKAFATGLESWRYSAYPLSEGRADPGPITFARNALTLGDARIDRIRLTAADAEVSGVDPFAFRAGEVSGDACFAPLMVQGSRPVWLPIHRPQGCPSNRRVRRIEFDRVFNLPQDAVRDTVSVTATEEPPVFEHPEPGPGECKCRPVPYEGLECPAVSLGRYLQRNPVVLQRGARGELIAPATGTREFDGLLDPGVIQIRHAATEDYPELDTALQLPLVPRVTYSGPAFAGRSTRPEISWTPVPPGTTVRAYFRTVPARSNSSIQPIECVCEAHPGHSGFHPEALGMIAAHLTNPGRPDDVRFATVPIRLRVTFTGRPPSNTSGVDIVWRYAVQIPFQLIDIP